MRIILLPWLAAFSAASLHIPSSAQPAINPALLSTRWEAQWIAPPAASAAGYGVHHLRRSFELAAAPASFVVHATADNRYQLFVNGQRVAWGPARGHLQHWRFETIDLAPNLRAGRNVVAAVVWNFGEETPMAQLSHETGFLLQGDGAAEAVVNTGPSWVAFTNPAYAPETVAERYLHGYYVAGPGDRVDGARFPWGWEQPDFDDRAWENAQPLFGGGPASHGAPRAVAGPDDGWQLEPRPIPPMEETPQRLARVRTVSGVTLPAEFPGRPARVEVPARTSAVILLDQGFITTAYPELIVSGGAGARVSVGYAESLYNATRVRSDKGDRNAVEGKRFIGYSDLFLPDGGAGREFRPLWWRTYRYVELRIQTAAAPLVIEDLRATTTSYPFERRARFEAGDPFLDTVLDVGWRTLRACAHETFVDCPYYEQLQYLGDARVQALMTFYNSGDPRLVRNAIAQIDQARTPEGVTTSRAPAARDQIIPPFSFWWIGMVHDYWRYVDDPGFVREMLPGVRAVLGYFEQWRLPDGRLSEVPGWNYVDWTPGWLENRSAPVIGADGASAPIDLQLLLALQWAADLEEALGEPDLATALRASATKLTDSIRQKYWSEPRRLFSDAAGGAGFSQQTNTLAVLAGAITGPEARALVLRILDDASLEQCSPFFAHYLHEAVARVGEGDRYAGLLGPWRAMLDYGLTTWAERSMRDQGISRSDCHAWSGAPSIHMFRTVLGIDSAAPGFKRVVIRPALGQYPRLAGAIPHPAGELAVAFERTAAGGLRAAITLPAGIEGELQWGGATRPLQPGANTIEIAP